MGLLLEIIQGVRKGARFKLRSGLHMGRKQGDIVLNDPKISSRHAHIEAGPGDELVLIDDGSSNGIRVNGQRVRRVTLSAGLRFQVGDTHFVVLDEDEKVISAVPQDVTNTREIPPAPPPPREWHEIVTDWLKGLNMESVPTGLAPFRRVLQLEFTQGLQYQTLWEMGYGPRQIGRDGIEFPVWDERAPGICFEVAPSSQGVIYRTKHSAIVQLNGKSVSEDFINEGDVISIGDTRIQIGFRK